MQTTDATSIERSEKAFRPWYPKRVLITPDALHEWYGGELYEKIKSTGIPIEITKNNRLSGLRGEDER